MLELDKNDFPRVYKQDDWPFPGAIFALITVFTLSFLFLRPKLNIYLLNNFLLSIFLTIISCFLLNRIKPAVVCTLHEKFLETDSFFGKIRIDRTQITRAALRHNADTLTPDLVIYVGAEKKEAVRIKSNFPFDKIFEDWMPVPIEPINNWGWEI